MTHITTKYSRGQQVWYIYGGKAYIATILTITIFVTDEDTHVSYKTTHHLYKSQVKSENLLYSENPLERNENIQS